MPSCDLDKIRSEIDKIDSDLVSLLKTRQNLVLKAADAKRASSYAAYSKEREKFVIRHCEFEAKKCGLPEGMMADIMRRVLRESYKQNLSSPFRYPRTLQTPGDVVIVGGNGGMGRIFSAYFENSGYKVFSFGHRGWDKAAQYLEHAKVVIVTVPIDITVSVIERLSPMLREDMVLCDFTSVKTPIVEAMMKFHKGPVLGLHPMFGPDVKSLIKQVVVTVPERGEKQSAFLVEQLRLWGARICRCTAYEHDQAMSIIQALRHFSTYGYGNFLNKLNPSLRNLIKLSSPIYRLELMMVGRLFAQDPRLYGDIIMSSSANYELVKSFVESLKDDLKVIEDKNFEEFTARFLNTRKYFGEYAERFMKESASLLAKLQDERDNDA